MKPHIEVGEGRWARVRSGSRRQPAVGQANRRFRIVRVKARAGEGEVIVKNLFQPDHRLPYEDQKLARSEINGALTAFGLDPSEPLRSGSD